MRGLQAVTLALISLTILFSTSFLQWVFPPSYVEELCFSLFLFNAVRYVFHDTCWLLLTILVPSKVGNLIRWCLIEEADFMSKTRKSIISIDTLGHSPMLNGIGLNPVRGVLTRESYMIFRWSNYKVERSMSKQWMRGHEWLRIIFFMSKNGNPISQQKRPSSPAYQYGCAFRKCQSSIILKIGYINREIR